MADRRELETPKWDAGWDGHREAQRRRLAQLPLSEKLAWLEEAHRVVNHLRGQRAGSGKAEEPPGRP